MLQATMQILHKLFSQSLKNYYIFFITVSYSYGSTMSTPSILLLINQSKNVQFTTPLRTTATNSQYVNQQISQKLYYFAT